MVRAPRVEGGRQAQAQRTKNAIVDAALDLFAEKGFDGASIEEIGRAANVSGPAIYRHFASKEELLVAAYEYAGRDRFQAVEQSTGLPAEEALELLLESFTSFTFDTPQWTKLWLLERGGRFPVDFYRATAFRQKQFFDRWQKVVAELRPDLAGREVRELVHVVWSIMNGTVYFPSELAPEDRATLLINAARSVLLTTQPLASHRPRRPAKTASPRR